MYLSNKWLGYEEKHHKVTCSKDIGPCFQITINYVTLNNEHNWEDMYTLFASTIVVFHLELRNAKRFFNSTISYPYI